MTLPANIRVNARVNFPANVRGSGFISLTKANGLWTIAPNLGSLNVVSAINSTQEFLLYDPANGSTSLSNASTAIWAAFGNYRLITASGDVTVQASDVTIVLNKTTGAATNVNLPAAGSRGNVPLTIKDLKGDAATNNITLVPSGTDTIDGFSAAAAAANGVAKIDIAYGVKRIFPLATGWIVI